MSGNSTEDDLVHRASLPPSAGDGRPNSLELTQSSQSCRSIPGAPEPSQLLGSDPSSDTPPMNKAARKQPKRTSYIPAFPKPSVPPPPPPVDLSEIASRENSANSSATVEFSGGNTILNFKCKIKSTPLGILKSANIELDLAEMVMRKVKDKDKPSVGIDVDRIVSTRIHAKNNTELDVQFMSDILGAPIQNKRYIFSGNEEAIRFQTHLDVMRASGAKLKQIFGELDKRNTGQISKHSLHKAMKENGMLTDGSAVEMSEAEKMIALADSDVSAGIDFVEFFRLFMFTPCITVHQALTEWRNKVALVQRKRTSSETANLGQQGIAGKGGGDMSKYDGSWVVGGEVIMNVVENVRYSFGSKARDNLNGDNHHWVGTLSVTNYRLVLQSHISGSQTAFTRHEVNEYFDRFDIPVNNIYSISKLDSSCVLIVCKDLRHILVSFEPNETFVQTLVGAISSLAFTSEGPKDTFAFSHALQAKNPKKKLDGLVNGWDLFQPMKEFERLGLVNSPHARFYRIWSDNFSLSDTYPLHFCVPSGMSESDIMLAAKFRSKCRMPAVSWRNKKNGAVLVRSAQPMVGLKSSRNASDEKLLNLYRVRGDPHNPLELEDPSTLYILDARKILAATGNQVQGKGTEIIANYAHAELVYCNIENIHVMRDSVNAVGQASTLQDQGELKGGFADHIKESLWLRHVQLVMKASVLAAERIELNDSSVLVHCSDGWDRTSQMSATCMLLLDPYYRTIEGFAILIEKEWLDFGHKFKDRHGQGSDKHPNERSPVFVQWLDTVHQLMHQFPTAFELNEELLVFVADHLHSCLFGTFLGNNAKERKELQLKEKTISIWTYVLSKRERFVNQAFKSDDKKILWPSTSIKKMILWERYFCRWDFECHPREGEGVKWRDDWGEKI
ncbi:hypothetical protein TrVE_jg11336 [Triparma verrucosa]|uniref:Phosphatidylinositol-3-phosphatase n=1 Tax=Triparma verrucosa TaxID=1606542 RepID=A0A9W7CET3_9STRA|nr:hypothetical protein TrVE_jg11336 [Triparma verrucosa]